MHVPDFVIIGAQRSGTSVLVHALRQHPEIWTPRTEQFFYAPSVRGHQARSKPYHEQFVPKQGVRVQGEKSPQYMLFPEAFERMREENPRMRLIATLRDPVLRMISQLHLSRKPSQRESHKWEKHRIDITRLDRFCDTHPDAFRRGLYATQLRDVLRHFPREQLLVLYHADLIQSLDNELERVCEWLGVDPGRMHYTLTGERFRSPGAERSVRSYFGVTYVTARYRQSNAELYQLLGDERILQWHGV